jgi:hypothetical protein
LNFLSNPDELLMFPKTEPPVIALVEFLSTAMIVTISVSPG